MEQLQKKTWNSKAVAEHTRLPSFNKKADKLNEVLKEYSRKTFEYHWNLSHLSPWNMVLKSLKISYKQEWSERLCLQFQSCFVLLDSYIKNMGVFIQIELFQLEGTYSYHLVQLPDQCGLNIFFPTQKSWCKSIKFTKLDQILLSPHGHGTNKLREGLDSAASPKVAESWWKRLEKGWGDIPTPAQLFHPMATTLRKRHRDGTSFTGNSVYLSRALRQWEGLTRDIFAIENTKEYKSRKVEKSSNSRWERQSTRRKEEVDNRERKVILAERNTSHRKG